MWLLTVVGFFSVVRKLGDSDLTIRARVRGDLEALKATYLPSLGEITSGGGTDYPYRARSTATDLANSVAQMIEDIDYANFKDAVAKRQGHARARLYGEVWSTLWRLTGREDWDG